MSEKKPQLEFDDIQGFVLRGFGKLAHACYVFFEISASEDFQTWLSSAINDGNITPASLRTATGGHRKTIAFSAKGLQKLMGSGWIDNSFPTEFVEGITQEHRRRLLGDVDDSSPTQWRWGSTDSIDGMFIVAAEDVETVKSVVSDILRPENGMKDVFQQMAFIPEDGKEPFGFADGISQPIIKGTDRAKNIKQTNEREYSLHAIAAGEFILGYEDGTGELPRSPAVSSAYDTQSWLAPHTEQPELCDFGKNGSFVVIRQLAQDVEAFNKYLDSHREADVDIGAKLVGRTKEGDALVEDAAAKHNNDFDYLEDLSGKSCPLGSHVRRTNPRSTVHASSQESSLAVTNRHRIIRRGRVYQNDDGETGLMFLCLNASINRQFEFIQATWCNDPFFQGLSGEVDPIVGSPRLSNDTYTIPASPYRYKLESLEPWVTVKGGGYFFIPGIKALSVLAHGDPSI